jgi:hypothetical protein
MKIAGDTWLMRARASKQVFNELDGNTWSSLSKLRACIGDVNDDMDSPLMEAEMKRQRGNSETGEVRAHLRGSCPAASSRMPRSCWAQFLSFQGCFPQTLACRLCFTNAPIWQMTACRHAWEVKIWMLGRGMLLTCFTRVYL